MSVPPRGRPPTDLEFSDYQLAFPALQSFSITGESDPSYDCVSFTVTPHAPTRLRPSQALVELGGFEALDVFYRERTFCRLGSVPNDHDVTCVAVFGLDGKPTHVALRDRHAEWWESKLGTGARILHRLAELEGGRYGRIVAYYALPRGTAQPDASGAASGAREVEQDCR
jgi:hypothetical protein